MTKHRGSVLDLPILTIVAITLIVGVVTLVFISGEINSSIPTSVKAPGLVYNSDPLQSIVDMTGLLDALIVFVILGSGIASVLLARQAPPQNAAFWWAGILVLICLGLVWAPLGNALIMFMSSGQISSTSNSFTYTTVLVRHFPTYMFILAALLAWATWGKENQGAATYYG
jgi:hypothetical protein